MASFFTTFMTNVNVWLDIPDLQKFCRTFESLYGKVNDHISCVYNFYFFIIIKQA